MTPRIHRVAFRPEFHAAILAGRKIQTIRPLSKAKRPREIRVGDRIQPYVWTGLPYRSKQENVGGPLKVLLTVEVRLSQDGVSWREGEVERHYTPLDLFARLDGFPDWTALVAWFGREHGLPFRGRLIRWAAPEGGAR